MKALTAVLPDLRQLVPRGQRWFTFWISAVLVGLELFGRSGASADYHDVLAVVVLISVLSLALIRHRKDPLPWMSWLERRFDRIGRRAMRLRHEFGLDLRGDPPLPRKLPNLVPAAYLGTLAVVGLFSLAWYLLPDGWRQCVSYMPYVLYLLVIGTIWAGLIAVIIAGVMIPVRLFETLIESFATGSKPAVAAAYMVSMLFLSFSLPAIIPLAFAGLMLLGCAAAMVLVRDASPAIVWKSQESKRVSSVPLPKVFALGIGLVTLLVVTFVVAACGISVMSRPNWTGSMPLTATVGSWAAWFIPGVLLVLVTMIWHVSRSNPARRTPPTVHVVTDSSAIDVRPIRDTIGGWGWDLTVGPLPSGSQDVGIRIVPNELSEAREFDPGWPLKVSLEDLATESLKDRLVRRDEIQLRRYGFRGLKKLFKRAGLQKGTGGSGVLFAPHWWFIEGLDREEEPDGDGDEDYDIGRLRRVGPSYDSILSPRVRQHWYTVLRAAEIDLIFIEDGVNYKSFERVLRQILEIYDRSAGQRKAEDHFFRGIPKVKVMIHDYAPGQSFNPGNDYPEPQFMELSRARVLHVFKDRGDVTELEDVPFDMSWEPEPLGLYS
ncbi:MAG: hypothetical protein U0798_15690 [Gemmataceae bacterium]